MILVSLKRHKVHEKKITHQHQTRYLCVGYFSLMEDIISCSTLWSVSVTRSTGELFCMIAMSFWSASRIIYQENDNNNRVSLGFLFYYYYLFCIPATIHCHKHHQQWWSKCVETDFLMPIIYKNLSCSDSYFSHKWPIIVVGKKGHHNRVKFFLCFSCTKNSNWNCSWLYLMTSKTLNNTLSLGISDDDPQDTRVSRPNKEQCSFIWVFFSSLFQPFWWPLCNGPCTPAKDHSWWLKENIVNVRDLQRKRKKIHWTGIIIYKKWILAWTAMIKTSDKPLIKSNNYSKQRQPVIASELS